MPIYTYKCKECQAAFDRIEGVIADPGEIKCPECGSREADKCFTSFNVGKSGSSCGSSGYCPTCPTCPGGSCGI